MVVLSIGNCGLKTLLDVLRDALVRESEIGQCLVDLLATDHRGNEVQLLRAGTKHAQLGHCFVVCHAAGVLFLAHDLLPLRFFVCGMTVIGPGR